MQHSCHSASQLSDQMFERQSHWNISVSWVCHYDVLHIFRVPPNYTAFSLRCSLSGSPCRLSPGSAGQLSASLYILHPGYLCVCGSALHPEQRTEVHHLWHLSVRCVWVSFFLSYLWFVTLTIPPLFFFYIYLNSFSFLLSLMSMFSSIQACASWSQPPSTQTASTSMRTSASMVTALSWRGSLLPSHSSPPSFTLCYARRLHEKDIKASSNQPKIFGWIYSFSENLVLVTKWLWQIPERLLSIISCFGHQWKLD